MTEVEQRLGYVEVEVSKLADRLADTENGINETVNSIMAEVRTLSGKIDSLRIGLAPAVDRALENRNVFSLIRMLNERLEVVEAAEHQPAKQRIILPNELH